ncbi:hypothetical protein BDF22DRAFT_746732 [Syncephalis plumigaleata]|nr:hypothetical protein BDF22DRAFT_746732 [Syncephalis plumigaleata]
MSNSRKQSSTTDPVLSTIKHGHLYNISSADDTSIIIRGPASFVASKLYDTPNANTDIDMAVQVVFEALFELFWKSVPMEFRRQPYPTDRRLKQWKLGDVERSIGPLHYVTSNMSWDQWCRRYFPRQNDAEMPTGLRARFLDTFKLQRKRFSGSRLHEFDSEIRRQFHQLDIVPAMVKNKTIWSKQKMLVDKREIFKLRAIKRPRH